MKFVCGACKTKYTISDDKVRGKVLKVKCKKCEAVVEVREAAAGSETVARVVEGMGGGSGHEALSTERPRTASGMEHAKAPEGGRPRTATGGVGGSSAPRPRTPTAPPPTPPDALKGQAPAGRPGTSGTAWPAAKGATGPAMPATRAPAPAPRAQADGKTSGVRPAARPGGGFLASGGGGGSGGLAGSLAEALSASMAPAPSAAEEDPSTVIAPFVSDMLAKPAPKEWWVAIRDTPTGPMTHGEVEGHIRAGRADADSLVWREGQDDWRPLREVHALSEILRGTGRAHLPKTPPGRSPLRSSVTPLPLAPDRSIGSVATPIGGVKGAVAVAAAGGMRSAPVPSDGLFPDSKATPARAGSGSLQIPIGDVLHGGAPPALAPVPRMPLVRDDSVAAPAPKKMSPLVWVAICGALAFGITLALGLLNYLAPRLTENPTGPTERVRVVTVGGALPPDLAPARPGEPRSGADEDPATQAGDPDRRPTGPRGPGNGTTTTTPGKKLSAADQALLARLGQQSGIAEGQTDPSLIRRTNQGGGSAGPSALTSDQVRAVVSRERASVQGCYERAMRGRSQPEDVRVTVVASVGASGAVTNVSVRGGNDTSMTQCIQSAVRRWRFPAAAGASQPEIPFLFTARATH